MNVLYFVVFIGSLFIQDECIHSNKHITESFLKTHSQIQHYVYNNKTKEAKIIAKDGSLIHFKRWACETKGASTTVLIPKQMGVKDAITYLLDHSKHFAEKTEVALISKKLNSELKKDIDEDEVLEYSLEIHADGYEDFYLLLQFNQEFTLVGFYYSK